MKLETVQTIDMIFGKMLEKTSRVLLKKDLSINKYCEGMVAAAKHVQMFFETLGMHTFEIYLDWGILPEASIVIETDYSNKECDLITITDEKYATIMAKSFDLVAHDPLAKMMTLNEYVEIIEEANVLCFEALQNLEGVSPNAGIDVLHDIMACFKTFE